MIVVVEQRIRCDFIIKFTCLFFSRRSKFNPVKIRYSQVYIYLYQHSKYWYSVIFAVKKSSMMFNLFYDSFVRLKSNWYFLSFLFSVSVLIQCMTTIFLASTRIQRRCVFTAAEWKNGCFWRNRHWEKVSGMWSCE